MRWWMGWSIGADPCFFLLFWQGNLRENEITISKKITAGVEAGRLSLLLTLKLNYKLFVKHQWIHEAQVVWIWLADGMVDGGVEGIG